MSEWKRADMEKPPNGESVLVVASGSTKNLHFEEAMVLGVWFEEPDGGWELEDYETPEDLKVSWWLAIPYPPMEVFNNG